MSYRRKLYNYGFELIDKLSKSINEDIVFAGGTGQYVTILKNKLQNPE